jgi:hypothetical protein
MAKVDLESLNIEELAALRDSVIEKLAEKVAVRQTELEAELEKLSGFGKPAKKAPAAAVAKPKKDDAAKEQIVRAA